MTGVVKSGRGLAVPRMAHSAMIERLQALAGCHIVPGTLNVRLPEPPKTGPHWRYLAAAEISPAWQQQTGQVGYFLIRVLIADRHRGLAFQADEPGYPPDQIELVAEVHLRTLLGLSDGDSVSFAVVAWDDSRCDAPKEPWISAKVQLKPSRIHGTGMAAVERIHGGERVVVFGGEYTDATGAQRARAERKLVMQWDTDLFTIEERGDDPTYFINHSCDPNLWMDDAFTLTARRKIEPGEELLADYALWEADEEYVSPWACRCGTAVCRKTVTGKDWHLPEIQRRYAGRFSPLLNKRIAARS
jgi:uncharacterized protein